MKWLARNESSRSMNRNANPWGGLMNLQKEMNQLFSDLDFPWTQRFEHDFDFVPSCETIETDETLTVRFDVPGMKKEDIKVEVNNNRLTVHGERREETSSSKNKDHFSEIHYGQFMRSFTLPTEVNADQVKASYKDGVLSIQVPKAQISQGRPIEIE